jgi:hypothetical protein
MTTQRASYPGRTAQVLITFTPASLQEAAERKETHR